MVTQKKKVTTAGTQNVQETQEPDAKKAKACEAALAIFKHSKTRWICRVMFSLFLSFREKKKELILGKMQLSKPGEA